MLEEKLPADDDNKKDDPFEEFINRDLGMDSLLRNSPLLPPDDTDDEDDELKRLSRFLRPQYRDALDEDDEDDDAERFQPRFGGFLGRLPSSGSSSTPSSDSPLRSSLGSHRNPFSSSSSSFHRPLSSRLSSTAGAKPPPPDPAPARTLSERVSDFLFNRSVADEFLFVVLVFAGLLVVVSTLLYIDNLRLSIALRDGQIQELRTQLVDLQRQLTPTAELPFEPIAASDQ